MSTAGPQEVVLVALGSKPFSFPIESVREVVQLVEPTPMPSWPDTALGMVEIRGELVPLLDPATALGMPPSPISLTQYIMVIEVLGRAWGLLVDGVEGVYRGELRPVSVAGGGALEQAGVARGIVRTGTAAVVVIEPEPLVRTLIRQTALEGQVPERAP